MTFSEVLNKYKSELNLTQSALAEICGTSPAVISRYLNGKRLPEKDSDIIKSIAKGIAEKSKDSLDLKLSAKDIEKELNDSIVSDGKESDFYSRLDALLYGKKVSNTELLKVLPYDSSYISRVRNKKRIPKDQEEFLRLLEDYLQNHPDTETKSESSTKAKAASTKEIKTDTTTSKETKSGEVKSEETKPGEVKSEETKSGEVKSEETKSEESKSEESKPEEFKSEENISKETPTPRKRPHQTRFEYFLEKVSSYVDTIRNINLPL